MSSKVKGTAISRLFAFILALLEKIIKRGCFEGRQLKTVFTADGDSVSLYYDANGRRTEKILTDTSVKYIYSGNMLIREQRSDKESMSVFGDDLIAGDSRMVGQVGRYALEYLYGQDGVTAIVYEGRTYYYRRNIQGDITKIFTLDGRLRACYTYDAWGNHKVTDEYGTEIYNSQTGITAGYQNHIGNINPIRYRGYYYDTEIGLYYCESRYYDSEVGRWINADDVAYLDPETINGLNLYAYCGNNPVMMTDSSGTFAVGIFLALAALFLFTPVGGTVTQAVVSAVSYVGMAVASIWDSDIRNDMNAIGWNPFNSNEASVLASNKVAFYKGVPIFLKKDIRSGSFYAILLDKNSVVDDLRHEWGHNVQAMIMGPGNFALTVGVMSPPALGANKWGGYYNSPWETGADMYGGVQGRTHTSEELSRAKWYMSVSTIFFPAAYFFLI